ncbi:MAG: ATP-binding protein [Chloroflexota bacterium]|nr:ATP-binding protein [Chloroflexota bacterium]
MGIKFEIWRQPGQFSLMFPESWVGFILMGLYLVLGVGFLFARRNDFKRMDLKAWFIFVVTLFLLLPASAGLIVSRSVGGVLLIVPVTVLRSPPTLSLVALLIVSALSLWWGPGPGAVAGFLAGVASAWVSPQILVDTFAWAVWGMLLGELWQQPYQGSLFDILRLPSVVPVGAALAPLILLSFNRLVESMSLGTLLVVDYAVAPFRDAGLLWLLSGLAVGIIFTVLFWLWPDIRPVQRSDIISLFRRSLRARLMIALVPLLVLSIVFSIMAVTQQALSLARQQALGEMARSADTAASGIANFYYTGSNLLEEFSVAPALREPDTRAAVLQTDRRVVPFFQEMLLVDADGAVVVSVPPDIPVPPLTAEEQELIAQALDFGMSRSTHVTALPGGEQRLTFIHPLLEGDVAVGAILGRVDFSINPSTKRVLETLQGTRGEGTGFILDDRNVIIAYPDPRVVLRPWKPSENVVSYPMENGAAYEDVGPDGNRVLVYLREVVRGITMVIRLPFTVVLEAAAFISNPLLYVQLGTGILLALILSLLAARITRPLEALSEATHQIEQGNLETPVHISGEDEVARLGSSFELMRRRLRDRLNDLSLLLQVSQSVSATLELKEGVPLILEGILAETQAVVARLVVLKSDEYSQQLFSVGAEHETFAQLDKAIIIALQRRHEPLVSQYLRRENIMPALNDVLRSLVAFPVRIHQQMVAVMWVGASEPAAFDEARMNFLNTLVSQAAVLVENTRLFQAAEGGRQRLAAILSSTTDAILVTDQEQQLLLINPAAQRILKLSELAYGRPVAQLEQIPAQLKEVLVRPYDKPAASPTVEVELSDGRVFVASVAPVKSLSEIENGSRVVVLRDVTHFKELDEMKTEFVSTVSHDLRAPLTFIQGYTSMLTMVGQLNDKQQEYMQRILKGIEQMKDLIDDLLNLRRIEAGVGIVTEPCRLGLVMLEAVSSMRARAVEKGISLHLEPSEGTYSVMGDRILLRQVISNLIDNAIKYTSAAGEVRLGLVANERDAEVVLHVTDTGMGISVEEQLRLFEKFYRIKRRETTSIPGTGLGLALVKSIVGRHGGRVWVDSKLNEGATFFVALPMVLAAET